MSGVPVDAVVRLNAYSIVSDAVERGVRWGLAHARKHVDGDPGDDAFAACLENDIMNELCEVLDFSAGEA